jgi:hypothetical protein
MGLGSGDGATDINVKAMYEPDYAGYGIANLMASIRGALGSNGEQMAILPCPALCSAQLADARHVVLLVIDGLGRAQLAQHAPDGAIARGRVTDLTSVFPSTTASAVTTYMTGDAPITHGLTGWHTWFKELGVIGAPLPFRIRGSGVDLSELGVSAEQLFQTRAISTRLARRSILIHPQLLCNTHYTRAHSGTAQVRPYGTLSELVDAICALGAETTPSYCYAYWPQLDSLAHVFGASSERAGAHLRELDEAVAQCAQRLRGSGTVLMVCADHGFIDTRADTRLNLADYPALQRTLLLPLCGEPRMVYCYVRAGAQTDFKALARDNLGHAADVFSAQDVLDRGWLGPGTQHARVHERLGTHVLVMKDSYCLTDQVMGETREFRQIGVHGGLSDAELRVPLAIVGD